MILPVYVDGGVNRNNGLRNRIDENNREFRERKPFRRGCKTIPFFLYFSLNCQKGTQDSACFSFRTAGINLNSLTSTSMHNDERGRMQLRGGIQIIFHRLEILFFADQRRGENKKSRIHRWDKHTGKEYSNILFSFLFKNFLVRYLREIIEEIIRYTRRRYLKDCSTLCSSITGSRDFNNGELRLVEYQY